MCPFIAWGVLAALSDEPVAFEDLDLYIFYHFISLGVFVGVFTLSLNPTNRGRFYTMLSWFANSGQAGRAASIAALVGKTDPAKTLHAARKSFKGVRFTDLSQASFESSEDSGLNELATRCRLGEIDAFLSHSWHDEPASKWAALERWGREFDAKYRRPPILWLDKASIDQQDIAGQLACLPVWLSGCKQMVVAAGPTFVTRLWCVLEVFTYLRLGRSYADLVLLPLEQHAGMANGHAGENGHDDKGPSAVEMVFERFRTFDVKKAQCFREEERQHLLSVIENGFGELDIFSSIVRQLFSQALESGEAMDDSTRTGRSSTRRGSSPDGLRSVGMVARVGARKESAVSNGVKGLALGEVAQAV